MEIASRRLKGFMVLALSLQMTACGTILHPERKGQIDGRIDAGIAILDGLGLLLFIIPGVIAYAVDFSNGTIYLPGTSSKKKKAVRFDPKHCTPDSLSALILEQTGYRVDWNDGRMRTIRLKTLDEIPVYLARSGRVSSRRTSI